MLKYRTIPGYAVGALLLCASSFVALTASAAGDGKVVIGVMSDQSGPFSDVNGKGVIVAAQLAIDEVGGKALGKPIELLTADPQNKTDVGLAIAQDWLEKKGVDVMADLPSSSLALALQDVIKTSGKGMLLLAGPNSPAITGASCSKYGFMWATDSYASANVAARGMIAQGADTWFFVQVDWAAGVAAADSLQAVIEAVGGKVLGRAKHPIGATDFSSLLVQAQSSGARVIALINTSADFLNSVRQAREFGIVQKGQKLYAGLTFYVTDAHALGLDVAQGLGGVSGYEWNMNPEAEAWSKKFFDKMGKMPNAVQIAQYSQVRHYLKAVEAAGTDDRDAVAAKMREIPINDPFVKNGSIRPNGRMIHDIMLIQAKAPSESKGEWDVFKVIRTLPGDQVFQTLEKSGCPLPGKT